MSDHVSLHAALDELGALTPRQIGALLRRQGITGVRAVGLSCPLAIYLSQRTGTTVWVGPDCARQCVDGLASAVPLPGSVSVPLPLSVFAIRRSFDLGGAYRYLDAECVS